MTGSESNSWERSICLSKFEIMWIMSGKKAAWSRDGVLLRHSLFVLSLPSGLHNAARCSVLYNQFFCQQWTELIMLEGGRSGRRQWHVVCRCLHFSLVSCWIMLMLFSQIHCRVFCNTTHFRHVYVAVQAGRTNTQFFSSGYNIVRCGLEASSSRQPPGKTTKSPLNV